MISGWFPSRSLCAVLIVGVSLLTSFAWALEPAGGSPEAVETGELDVDDANDDSETAEGEVSTPELSRTWLRAERSAERGGDGESTEEGEGARLTILGGLLLVGLAGGAMLLRLRRKAVPSVIGGSPIRVISSTRVGPKASLVAVEVDGRGLLLGVTEQSVSELGWLDGSPQEELEVEEEGDVSVDQIPGAPRKFKDILGGFLGGTGAGRRGFASGSDVAAMLAESTQDVLKKRTVSGRVEEPRAPGLSRRPGRGSPLHALNAGVSEERFADSRSESPVRIEAQAAGLARRRN